MPPVSNDVDLVSGMVLAIGDCRHVAGKTLAASAVLFTEESLSLRRRTPLNRGKSRNSQGSFALQIIPSFAHDFCSLQCGAARLKRHESCFLSA